MLVDQSRSRFRGRCAAVACVIAVLVAACGSDEDSSDSSTAESPAPESAAETSAANADAGTPVYGGTLRFASAVDVTGLDPNAENGGPNLYVLGSLYDSLIDYDDDGNLVGSLVESWTHVDPTTLEFNLRQSVTFHDGSDFDADDVVATFNRVADPATNSPDQATAASATLEVVDPFTVRIKLDTPSAGFLYRLADRYFYVVSSDDVESGLDFATKANGTGPFKLVSSEPGFETVLERNDNYWLEGFPYLDRLVVKGIGDDTTRVNALLGGEADLIEFVPWQEWERVETSDYEVVSYPSGFGVLQLNVSQPPLDNKLVRQALNYIIDRQEVLDLAFGGNVAVMDGNLITPSEDSPFYYPEHTATYVKDHDRALELLQEAGYATPGDVPPLQMKVAQIDVHRLPAEVVHQQLTEFGLDVEYVSQDVATFVADRAAGDFQIDNNATIWPVPDPFVWSTFFHSEKGTAFAATKVGYANPELDALLEQGSAATDLDERIDIYRDAEAIILDDAPWVPLVWWPRADAYTSEVNGYVVVGQGGSLWNTRRMEHLWLSSGT